MSVFDHGAAVATLLEEFPKLKGHLQVIAAQDAGRVVSGSKTTLVLRESALTAQMLKAAACKMDPFAAEDVFPVMPGGYNNDEMWHRYMFDRDAGRLLIAGNRQDNHAACAAEAYALIRHMQRYGQSSTFPAFISDMRNMNAAHNADVKEWTPRVADNVIALNAKGILKALSPQQVAALARRIADAVKLSDIAAENMAQAFAAVGALVATQKPEGDRALDIAAAVSEIGAKTESAATLEACKRYMARFSIYLPQGAVQTRDKAGLDEIAKNLKIMRTRKVTGEPKVPPPLPPQVPPSAHGKPLPPAA